MENRNIEILIEYLMKLEGDAMHAWRLDIGCTIKRSVYMAKLNRE